MYQVAFLYKGSEQPSAILRDSLRAELLRHQAELWSDVRSTDAGFSEELEEKLLGSDAIVHSVTPAGLGNYQRLNEVEATVRALRQRADRRLVIACLNGAEEPPEFAAFAEFAARTTVLKLTGQSSDAATVIGVALPNSQPVADDDRTAIADEVVDKVIRRASGWSLTIVIGPYAFAEAGGHAASPACVIRRVLRDDDRLRPENLRGFVPWLDVVGSVARSVVADDDDA